MSQQITENHIRIVLEEGLKLDLTDPNLKDTPKRISKMLHQELLHNINEEYPAENFSAFPNNHGYSQIILMDHIHFTSMCSHHFLPFEGIAFFAYIPDKFLVGASKMARLIEYYGARPQLQENLCHEVINRFIEVVQPRGAMLVTRAIHGCMTSRGVKQYANSGMATSVISGCFNDATIREECMNLIKLTTMLR